MRKRNCEQWLVGLREPCQKYMVAAIILIALSMWSCSTTKQTAQSQSREVRDSLVIKETREAIPVTVPESKAQLTIPMESLRKLPPGATYTEKSGQATVEAKYVPDNPTTGEPEYIIVTSTCDSLQLLCWKQEKELIRIRNDTEKEKIEIKEDAAKQKNRCLWAGFICGICVTVVIRFLINKVKRFF
uniref:Uncharacterized protein n=1 Tax=Myoviridae sp. ct9MV2 TaxID=2826625 RepID=A0A8S5NDF6_9CAUD|nr:MAG TPA: hypothetical protein [Myoviridae sp. ct9MV2]